LFKGENGEVIPEDPQDALAECRGGIDSVDRRIVELLN
jgi:hypothetical protein